MSDHKITFGDIEVPVYPQRVGYLRNRLATITDFVGAVQNGSAEASFLDVDRGAHALLCLLIPKFSSYMPLHKFLGFASEQTMDAGEYVEADDQGATIPEIRTALETALEVNRIDFLTKVKDLLGPTRPQELLGILVDEAMDEMRMAMSTRSRSSRSDSDGSPTSTSSSTTPPTPIASAA